MRTVFISLITVLMLSACESQHDREIKEMESRISATIQMDWRDGIPLNGLVDASQMCQKYPDLKDCGIVEHQIQDIATAVATCKTDQRSSLCQAVVRVISKHPVSALLPKANALQLPDTPWYWNMPTAMLEAQAWNYGYRKETAIWWWQAWGSYILFCVALLLIAYGGWFWWSAQKKANVESAASKASQCAAHAEQERIRLKRDNEARVEAERHAKLVHDAAIVKQKRLAAEKYAEQQAAQAAARLAAEQDESARLLDAAFKPISKPKREKHVTSSQ